MNPDLHESLKKLPKVDAVMGDVACEPLVAAYGRPAVLHAVRSAIESSRAALTEGRDAPAAGIDGIVALAGERLAAEARPNLRHTINATGIVLHTNLGRAPLGEEALRAVDHIARGYSNLEYDLAGGARGSRQTHVDSLLCRLTQAEGALVVNNNAAAVMLAVNTIACEGEVVTSRGELIEIGGSFRIPDVIETSEARLVETGTTNRTRVSDFARAITPNTRALLKVHPSNYRIVGFTESPTGKELAALASMHGLVSIEDLGSGTLVDLSEYGLPAEPTVQDALRDGMDLVTFSGDKLLGGPQAGIIVGRAELIARMKQNPLYRALRVDKMTLAALEATLQAYLNPERLAERLPVIGMLAASAQTLEARAHRLAELLKGHETLVVSVQPAESFAGGGSLPEESLPDFAVVVATSGRSANALHERLRDGAPPIVARVADGAFRLHMRTLSDDDLPVIAAAFARLVS